MPMNDRIAFGKKDGATPHSAPPPQTGHSHFPGFGETDSPIFSGETPAPKLEDDGRKRTQAPPP